MSYRVYRDVTRGGRKDCLESSEEIIFKAKLVVTQMCS